MTEFLDIEFAESKDMVIPMFLLHTAELSARHALSVYTNQ